MCSANMVCVTQITVCWASVLYWAFALVVSLFYAIFAVDALEVSDEDKKKIAENCPLRWHQRWLNFLGSIVGWCVAYVVLQHTCSTYGFRPVDLPLAFLAFVGMTGHLPYVVKHVWKWQFPWRPAAIQNKPEKVEPGWASGQLPCRAKRNRAPHFSRFSRSGHFGCRLLRPPDPDFRRGVENSACST